MGPGVSRASEGKRQRWGTVDMGSVRVVLGMELGLREVKRGQKKLGENGEIDIKKQNKTKTVSPDEVQRRLRGIREVERWTLWLERMATGV